MFNTAAHIADRAWIPSTAETEDDDDDEESEQKDNENENDDEITADGEDKEGSEEPSDEDEENDSDDVEEEEDEPPASRSTLVVLSCSDDDPAIQSVLDEMGYKDHHTLISLHAKRDRDRLKALLNCPPSPLRLRMMMMMMMTLWTVWTMTIVRMTTSLPPLRWPVCRLRTTRQRTRSNWPDSRRSSFAGSSAAGCSSCTAAVQPSYSKNGSASHGNTQADPSCFAQCRSALFAAERRGAAERPRAPLADGD